MTRHHLTPLQLRILRELWSRREATVTELHTALPHERRRMAPTTLATVLSRLNRRGVVAHRTRARQFVYRAVITEEEVRHSMVNDLTSTLFAGDAPALVQYLLTRARLSGSDLSRIRAMVGESDAAKSP